ncbi:hypothetical protein HK405_006339 [Cladochytrium tenue]|nr:hypothetical protein HK405_006339 [Cladochytrium tenue]
MGGSDGDGGGAGDGAIRVVVVGAGVGGLALANALLRDPSGHKVALQLRVFERDGDPSTAGAGPSLSYSLDLDTASQRALARILPPAALQYLRRAADRCQLGRPAVVAAETLRPLFIPGEIALAAYSDANNGTKDNTRGDTWMSGWFGYFGGSTGILRVPRAALIHALRMGLQMSADGASPDSTATARKESGGPAIKYGHRLVRVECRDDDGTGAPDDQLAAWFEVRGGGGSGDTPRLVRERADILVGADGVRSTARAAIFAASTAGSPDAAAAAATAAPRDVGLIRISGRYPLTPGESAAASARSTPLPATAGLPSIFFAAPVRVSSPVGLGIYCNPVHSRRQQPLQLKPQAPGSRSAVDVSGAAYQQMQPDAIQWALTARRPAVAAALAAMAAEDADARRDVAEAIAPPTGLPPPATPPPPPDPPSVDDAAVSALLRRARSAATGARHHPPAAGSTAAAAAAALQDELRDLAARLLEDAVCDVRLASMARRSRALVLAAPGVSNPPPPLLLPSSAAAGRIALLGDAVRSMPPFRNTGAALALADALDLAEELRAATAAAAVTRDDGHRNSRRHQLLGAAVQRAGRRAARRGAAAVRASLSAATAHVATGWRAAVRDAATRLRAAAQQLAARRNTLALAVVAALAAAVLLSRRVAVSL